jgi:hypothetical protein
MAPQQQTAPPEPARKRYRLRPSGCCDLPRVVHLTDAEAAPGLASGMLQPLPDLPPTNVPETPRSPS